MIPGRRTLLVLALACALLTTHADGQVYQGHGTGGGGGGGGASTSVANTWTALQTFSSGLAMTGTITSGVDGIGATSTNGFVLRNTTPAMVGAQQWSPRSCWSGNGWKTTAAAASEVVTFCVETQPVQGTADPSGLLVIKSSINGGAFVNSLTLVSGGGSTTSTGAYISNSASIGLQTSAGATGADVYNPGTTNAFRQGRAAGAFDLCHPIGCTDIITIATSTPTLASGFGTTSALVAGRASAFRWNVGTGGAASSGVITLGAAAITGWNCQVDDLTALTAHRADQRTVQTASTTTTITLEHQTVSTGAALAWADSDVLKVSCLGY